jgi:formiminoglutamase
MSLNIFFNSLNESDFSGIKDPSSFKRNISINFSDFPEWIDAHLAIIGVPEERGTAYNKGTAQAPDAIRQKLYRLKRGSGAYKIVDFGNIRAGIDLDETHSRLREVCALLLENKILPIILGGSHDLTFGQYMGYQVLGKRMSIVNIDALIDMEEFAGESFNQHHLYKILTHPDTHLLDYTHLGYQTYLVNGHTLDALEKLHFEARRLGVVKEDLIKNEPLIRDADMMSFDVSAIKQTDAPGCAHSQPFGLTGEEACQLCWYAGQSNKLTSVGFYEYNPALDMRGQTAGVVATMIWYFVEGYYNRKPDFDMEQPSTYYRYLVQLNHDPHYLTFYKCTRTDKWWLGVPYNLSDGENDQLYLMPCSYSEYLEATQGEVPLRWIITHAKLQLNNQNPLNGGE